MAEINTQEKRRKLNAQVNSANSRARQANLPATVTEGQFIAGMRSWDWKCAVCKSDENTLNMDHWIPLSAVNCPGSVIENLVPLCHGCNVSKKNQSGDIWLARRFTGRDLDEMRMRLATYQSSIASLPTSDMSIPDTYIPASVTVRRRRANVGKVLLRLYTDDPEQCRLWEYYQELTHRGKGTEWIVDTLVKALPPNSKD